MGSTISRCYASVSPGVRRAEGGRRDERERKYTGSKGKIKLKE